MKAAFILAVANGSHLLRSWTLAKEALLADAVETELWICGDSAKNIGGLILPEEMKKTPVLYPGDWAENARPEVQLTWLEQLGRQRKPDLLIFYDNITGHQLAVGLAARLSCPVFTDVYNLSRGNGGLTATRKTCGSYLDWVKPVSEAPFVLAMAPGLGKASVAAMRTVIPEEIPLAGVMPADWVIKETTLEQREENPLETAQKLLVGGKGLGSKAACDMLRELAAKLDAQVGFTRPVAMNGWCGLHEIVGQSGVRTAPELCVTFGVSGAAAFLAGVRDAQKLVAVNTDPDAPIFRHADIGILEDARIIIEEMNRQE